MATTILVEIAARTGAGAATVVRLAGGGRRGYTHLGQTDWVPGVVAIPRFTTLIGFGQDGWTGGAIPQTGAVTFAPSRPGVLSMLAGLVWPGATITVRVGDDAIAAPVWTAQLLGTVAGATIRNGILSLTVQDLSGKLADSFLKARFAGTGGIEGDADAKDRIKRRTFGRAFNVDGRLLLKAHSIYEFSDPAFPLQGFAAIKDRGRAAAAVTLVPWAGTIAATLAALIATAAPAGGAAAAPSIACVKWWTQPGAPLTADLLGEVGAGYVETAPEIAQRIVAAASTLTVGNVDAMAAARPGPAGAHVENESESAAQVLDRLLFDVSVTWVLDPAGVVQLLPIGFDDPVEAVTASDVWREASYKPVGARILGYQRNHRTHTDAEISAVFQAADGTYADGTPIEDLKPGEPGATLGGVIGTPEHPGTVFDLEGNPLFRDDLVTSEGTALDTANVDGQPASEIRGDLVETVGSAFDLAATVMRQNQIMQERTTMEGRSVKRLVAEVRDTANGASASVVQIMEALADPEVGFARFLLRAAVDEEDGSATVVGLEAFAGVGGISVLKFMASLIQFLHPGTLTPMIYFDTLRGLMVAKGVEVDTLKVNTAAIPVWASASSNISGSGTGGGAPWVNVLAASIVLPVAGWIEASFVASQSFSSDNEAWEFDLSIGGETVYPASSGLVSPSITLIGARYCEAGTIPVVVTWKAHSSITLRQRRLWIKGFPGTE